MTQYTLSYLPERFVYMITSGERVIQSIAQEENEHKDDFKERAIRSFDIFISSRRKLVFGNAEIIKTELA